MNTEIRASIVPASGAGGKMATEAFGVVRAERLELIDLEDDDECAESEREKFVGPIRPLISLGPLMLLACREATGDRGVPLDAPSLPPS